MAPAPGMSQTFEPEDQISPGEGVRLNGVVVTGAGAELREKLGANYIRQKIRAVFGSSGGFEEESESKKLAIKGADAELKGKLAARRAAN